MAKTYTPLEKRLAGYAAAAGIALATPPSADAQVVYTDLDPDVVVSGIGSPDSFQIDFDEDGATDIIFNHTYLAPYLNAAGIAVSPFGVAVIRTSGANYASVLSSGTVVNGAGPYSPVGRLVTPNTAPWSGQTEKFVGVSFLGNLTGVPITSHYGWVRLSMPLDGTSITVHDYAYESTPDTPITINAIPVELVSFDAQVSNGDVVLNWETASETNNAGFEVQMQQGEDWNVLGFVQGNGTTTEAQTYSFTADGMDVGTHTFRLKQIDFDGAFEYSPEVEATIEVVGTHQLSNAYPNPFNPTSQFTLAVASNQQVKAELYNVLGQRVATLFDGSVDANAAQIVQIDGSGLASGAYIVRVTGETFADALRVTLTK